MYIQRLIHQALQGSRIRISTIQRQLRSQFIAVTSAVVFAIALLAPVGAQAQQSASMVLSGQTSVAANGTLTVEIRVKTQVSVNAVQADVNFPTSLLAYESASSVGSAFNADLINSAANGNITLVRAKIGGGSGDMLVATLTFKAIKDGRAEIRLLDSSMATDSNTSENVVSVRQGLTVTVGNAPSNAPIETGSEPEVVTTSVTPDPSNPTEVPSVSPDGTTTEPDGTDDDTKSGETKTTNAPGVSGTSLSATAWAIIMFSLLLIVASIFFSLNLLRRRSRRLAAYQRYMQQSVNPMYNQGQFYDFNQAGYTAQQTYQQQTPYQQIGQQATAGYVNSYMPQYPQQPQQPPHPQTPTQALPQQPQYPQYPQPNPYDQSNQQRW